MDRRWDRFGAVMSTRALARKGLPSSIRDRSVSACPTELFYTDLHRGLISTLSSRSRSSGFPSTIGGPSSAGGPGSSCGRLVLSEGSNSCRYDGFVRRK